nr:cytochrome C oxidase assembly protein COX15 [Ipomoea batatas]
MRQRNLLLILRQNKALGSKLLSNLNASTQTSDQYRLFSSIAKLSPLIRRSITRSFVNYGFRSFHQLNHKAYRSSFRNFSSVASTVAETKEGLKLLVTAGPHAQKMIGIWLFTSAAWVFSMVVLGGITRLTRSGLSMTDWKFTGRLPPLSHEQWMAEFEKYKQSPEFKRVNMGMTIEDFKFIYWMEYAHRMWGRALGIMFALPFSYFLRKGYITMQLGLRLSGLFALGAGQGLVGWWMVRSGLETFFLYIGATI